MRLNVKAYALTTGLLWSVGVFFMTWWIIFFDGSTGEKMLLGRFYRGYNISATGSLIGFIWALPDGIIGGAIFAWLYNALAKRSAPESNSRAEIGTAVID